MHAHVKQVLQFRLAPFDLLVALICGFDLASGILKYVSIVK
jgi:hypothetical protein